MIFFDTHYHHKEGVDFAAEIAAFRAEMAANDKLCMITLGGSLTESIVAQKVANSAENVWFCAGVHPHCADEFLSQGGDFDELENDPKCCAVGEIGLDYFYDFSDEESQKKVFAYFLERALAKNMPAVIHVRDKEDSVKAYEDAYDLLSVFAAKGGRFELHSYAGNIEFLEKFSNLGAYFSVNGMVTFKKADNIRMNLQKMPLDRLLIETDSPYLAPEPLRGKMNDSRNIKYTAECLALIRGMTVSEIEKITTENALKIYNKIGK